MNKYDVLSGDLVTTLFEETDPKYVEPENPLYFLPNKTTILYGRVSVMGGTIYIYTIQKEKLSVS